MSEKLKTIKELADELGVSKKKVHYQVSKLDSNLIHRLDGTIYLGNKATKVIKEHIGYIPDEKIDTLSIQNRYQLDAEKNKLIDEKSEQINYLKEQIKNKDEQLSVKDEQIKSLVEAQKHTQNLLDQQQQLALKDKNLLEEYKVTTDILKSLEISSQDIQENQHQEFQNVEGTQQSTSKKWYQFWKK